MQLNKKALDKLQNFEDKLDPQNPEGGDYDAKIVGYGEMSTVFTFSDKDLTGIVFKRMALFHSNSEVEKYQHDYLEYNKLLNELDMNIPDYGSFPIKGRNKRIVLFLSQKMLNPACVGNKVIHSVDGKESIRLLKSILERFDAVYRYNLKATNDNEYVKLGFDGQLSNWVVNNWDGSNRLPAQIKLGYLDTSTPLMQKKGVEQINPELFLRICPASLVWIIRLFFLKGVLTRYYDIRLVIIDLIANLFKEKKTDLIEDYMKESNDYLGRSWPEIKPIVYKEIVSYYKEDAMIWRLFLAFRRMERSIRLKLGKSYELILPGNVER